MPKPSPRRSRSPLLPLQRRRRRRPRPGAKSPPRPSAATACCRSMSTRRRARSGWSCRRRAPAESPGAESGSPRTSPGSAPEPIRSALVEGAGWWSKAFEDAGYIDAFRVEVLPEGADPLDVRYNVIHWVNRATRGWSYGQPVIDPRTGETIKGSVLLGSLRVRQDILIFESLAGADQDNTGGPNDPVRVALTRIRQLGAHETGHALGFAHNFAASTQGRISVMDYPPPRIGLKDGRIDLSDAYATGIGRWDRFTVDWLYGTGDANAKTTAAIKEGLRFVTDGDARPQDAAQPWGSLWDDGADPAAELSRMMAVRRAAIDQFGTRALHPGEPVADLRRRYVPIFLLHRYQLDAASKMLGGVVFAFVLFGVGCVVLSFVSVVVLC